LNGMVVIVDDVITTGATLNSAAKALKLAGAQRVFALALCGTPKTR
jgi:predicted amidophosphoribosyltransferase